MTRLANRARSPRRWAGVFSLVIATWHTARASALQPSSDPYAAPAAAPTDLAAVSHEPELAAPDASGTGTDNAAAARSQAQPGVIEIVEKEPAPVPVSDSPASCDLPLFSDKMPKTCRTPRAGTLSGGFLALDLGFFQPSQRAAEQAGLGPGIAGSFRLGFELWDALVLAAGISGVSPADRRPTSETVVDCHSIQGALETCETNAHSQSSEISGGEAAIFEAGLQHRFRPWRALSISPGAMLGYTAAFRSLKRGVDCSGCASTDLHLSVSGGYVAPFLRVTFGQLGMYAAVVRSAWFFSGEMRQMTTLGIEALAP